MGVEILRKCYLILYMNGQHKSWFKDSKTHSITPTPQVRQIPLRTKIHTCSPQAPFDFKANNLTDYI